MTDKQKHEYAEAICKALFGTEYKSNDPESGDDTIDRLLTHTFYNIYMAEIIPCIAENALSAPIVCSVPCKNCDIMRDSFAKTMRIFARNYAQVFAQKRDVENAMVLHELCINLSPFAS